MFKKLLSNSKFWLIVKLVLAAGFIYYFSEKWDELDWTAIGAQIDKWSTLQLCLIITLFLTLFVINWLADTYLWWSVVRRKVKITFGSAFRINLISHSVGLVTPANIGEYGIKALHFTELGQKRQSVLLTLSYRSAKWYAKSAVGLIAGIWIWWGDNDLLSYLCGFILIALIISYRFLPSMLDRLYHSRLGTWAFDKEDIANWNFKDDQFYHAIPPAFVKFLSYTGQLSLLVYMGSNLGFLETMMRSGAIYSLASFIPTLSLFDPVVKASIGEIVMVPAGVSLEWLAVSTALVWLINLGIPSAIGYGMWIRSKN